VNGFKKTIALQNAGGLLLVAAVGLFWWAGAGLLPAMSRNQNELDARFSPALPQTPQPSQAAVTLNREAGRPVDLDGLAVVYPDEVDQLVRHDGSFRTDLAREDMAKILNLTPAKLASSGSPTKVDIDPDTVLFRVALGRLTEESKTQCREIREIAAREHWEVSPEVYEWVMSERTFTMSALTNPNPEQKMILDAISRTARGLPAPQGRKIRAVACWRVPRPGESAFAFTAGFLPREEPTAGGVPGAGTPADDAR
jgi:hypothetical protein